MTRENHHRWTGEGFRCPATGKEVPWVFWDKERPGSHQNACPECHEDQRTPSERLEDIAEKRIKDE